MPDMPIHIQVNDQGLESKLRTKAGQIGPELVKRVGQMLNTIQTETVMVTPRGSHCTGTQKAGNLKGSIRNRLMGDGGQVYVDERTAPYAKSVLEGRGPIVAGGRGSSKTYQGKYIGKSAKGRRAPVLHFCIAGKHIFVRHVGPAKANNFLQKGYTKSFPLVRSQADAMGRWLEQI